MKKFVDISDYSLEDKELLFKDFYREKLFYVGRKHYAIDEIVSLNNNTKSNPKKLSVLEGIWGVSLILKYKIKIKSLVICIEDINTIEAQNLVYEAYKLTDKIYVVSKRVFTSISESINKAQGIMALFYLDIKTLDEIEDNKEKTLVILDALEIHGNIGTILRSCDATAIKDVIFVNRKIRLNHPKLIRSSMGSFLNLNIIDVDYENLIDYLKIKGYKIYLTDTDAERIYKDEKYADKSAFVIGSEKYGISRAWYEEEHEKIKIPMYGDCDSLNVAIATTVILYDRLLKK